MKKIISFMILSLFIIASIHAQKYFTKTGEISFYSKTMIEDIEAVSNTATTVFDSESGKMQWAVLIKSFYFEKALMQEHFNENYMESSAFPKASFKGSIINYEILNLNKDGSYIVEFEGDLTIHGVTNAVRSEATFTVANGIVKATSNLKVKVASYGIDVPAVVRKNIAEEIVITINAEYAKLDKS